MLRSLVGSEMCIRDSEAAMVFATAGFGPTRLAQGEDWFIEPWEGNGAPEIGPHVDKFRELGRFVADYHLKLPIEWYEPWRDALRKEIPALDGAAEGCHVWWWTARPNKWLVGLDAECLELWASDYFFAPQSEVGRRLVTAHGDLNEGNMLQMDDGLRCIDFEFSCVTNAIQDLSYVVGWITEDTYRQPGAGPIEDKSEKKRAFLEAYLEGVGQPCGPEQVDALLLDAEISWLAHSIHNTGIRVWNIGWSPESFRQEWEAAKRSVQRVRESEELQQEVLRTSFAAVHKELKAQP
eukprot:TRINITY_DN29230_c0_g1_i1.p1 TRINITY_DN29230_c0_g1~~TRINITY_DN29230_c0_g1_i1.p1  ORF type:complete len:294 (-),score=45.31 TRINITY_DN29230_c0_g1_i1:436-1317(-)